MSTPKSHSSPAKSLVETPHDTAGGPVDASRSPVTTSASNDYTSPPTSPVADTQHADAEQSSGNTDILDPDEDKRYALAIEPYVADPGEDIIPALDPYVPPHWAPGQSPLLFLPNETKLMIVANFEPEHEDILYLSMTVRELRDICLSRFWSVIEEDRSLINLLLHPQNVQQTYANHIKDLHMTVNDPRIDVSLLRFNNLEKLTLRMPRTHLGKMQHDISNLLGPRLTSLELKNFPNDHYERFPNQPMVANFLPYLNRSAGLKHLRIGFRIDATHQEVLSALQSCPELETLDIHHLGPSSDRRKITIGHHTVHSYLFRNRKLKHFLAI